MAQPPTIGPGKRRRPPRPLLRRVLGDGLRRTRLEQGRTLADVAAAARVSMQYLSELERGRKEASSEILDSLCDALDVDLSDLLLDLGRSVEGRERAAVLRLESARVVGSPTSTKGARTTGVGDAYCLAA